MTSKVKTLLKVGLPLVIVIQLISITFLLAKMSKDKAFSCKAVGNYFVCKQIELKWYIIKRLHYVSDWSKGKNVKDGTN